MRADLVFNLISIGIMGLSGLLINIVIAMHYNAASLGVFNQVYAIYIFASQLAVIGVPASVLKYVAEFGTSAEKCRTIISSAILLAVVFSSLVCVAVFSGRYLIGSFFDSPGVTCGLLWGGGGLFFFAVNKVLLSAINGLERMKVYAVYQSFRYISMLVSLLVLAMIDWPGDALAFIFTISEILLFIVCVFTLRSFIIPGRGEFVFWIQKHVHFGVKSFVNALLLELNTRIDVLMLGYFCNDSQVGIYSFAAMLAEGLFQLLGAVMRVVTPKLVILYASQEIDRLKKFSRNVMLKTYLGMILFAALFVLTYPYWICLLTDKQELRDTWNIVAILSCGVTFASGYVPLRNILMGAGFPGWQSIQTSFLVLINILGNLCLIPLFGLDGAAMGTALSLASIPLLLKVMTRRVLGWSI